MRKITKEVIDSSRRNCFDYMYKNDSANLRERYVFLFLDGDVGIYLVECNTEGKFVVKEKASLSEAYTFIFNT